MSGYATADFRVRRREAARADPTETHVVSVMTLDLLLVIATQLVAIPLAGRESQIASAFLIHFGVIGYLALRGMVLVSLRRLFLLSLFALIVCSTQIGVAAQGFSLPSLVLMLATSTMLVFVVPLTPAAYRDVLRRFVLVGLVAAALSGVDWGLQKAGLPMPNLKALIPQAFVYYEYNYIQPLQWGSAWIKPNGVFFLETSHLSQFIALALVIEAAMFRRVWIMIVLAVALLGTLGATGLVLAGSCVPFLLARIRPAIALTALTIAGVGLFAAAQTGVLDNFAGRTAEFSQRSSSGYNRFVLPMEWSLAALEAEPEKAWLGTGAGSMPKAINDEDEGIAGYTWPPYTKVGVEYGALALLAWLLFIGCSLFNRNIPLVVSWAAFVQYNFLNGSLNVPIHTVYCVLICAGYVIVEGHGKAPSDALGRRWTGFSFSLGRLRRDSLNM